MGRRVIGAGEREILSVLRKQPDNAYGTTLRARIAEQFGHEPSVGALHTTLDRLEAKGMISSSWGEPTAERGGRRKRYYRIEAQGRLALQEAEEHGRRSGFNLASAVA